MKTVNIVAEIVRRFPDPLNNQDNAESYNIEHILAICKAKDIPEGIPLDPNPRNQRTDRKIYRDVKKSLLSEDDPTFLLKNKGITLIARHAEIANDKHNILIKFAEGDGIVDGGHTYRILLEAKPECPENQYVKLEILTGIPRDFNELIAEGLNTAVQVQQMSLSNLAGKFEWIKETLKDEPYADKIAYKEGEDGVFDVRDIVAFLTLFNIDRFPENSSEHPKIAYTSKGKALEFYLNKQDEYEKLRPILKDILYISDYVQLRSHELYNDKFGGKGRALAFYETKKRGEYEFIFAQKNGRYRIYDGALYPILGALRFLIEQKEGNSHYNWKLGSREKVLEFFDKVGADLINITKKTSEDVGRNPNAIGKNDNHWAYLYQTVAYAYLQNRSVNMKAKSS